jgi:hypothetical protein
VTLIGILSAISIVLSLLFVARQTHELTRQTRINNSIGTATAVHDLIEISHNWHGNIIERPDLRPYFFADKVCSRNNPDYPTVATLAELLADLLDYDLLTANLMPGVELTAVWHHWPRHMLGHSPILREVVEAHGEWWPGLSKFWQLVKAIDQQPSTDGSNPLAFTHPLIESRRTPWPDRVARRLPRGARPRRRS